MITKEETVKKLKERGYNACLNKGIVTILYKDVDEYENIKDPVRDTLRIKTIWNRTVRSLAANCSMNGMIW